MEIRNCAHKGLKNFVEKNDARKLPSEDVERIRRLITFLLELEEIGGFFAVKRGNPHVLKGDRAGVYAISVRANWRLTFRHDLEANEIFDLDLEDYHGK